MKLHFFSKRKVSKLQLDSLEKLEILEAKESEFVNKILSDPLFAIQTLMLYKKILTISSAKFFNKRGKVRRVTIWNMAFNRELRKTMIEIISDIVKMMKAIDDKEAQIEKQYQEIKEKLEAEIGTAKGWTAIVKEQSQTA